MAEINRWKQVTEGVNCLTKITYEGALGWEGESEDDEVSSTASPRQMRLFIKWP